MTRNIGADDGAIPANVRARVRETYDPVNEPNLPLSIATTLVEGAITINEMPPPDSEFSMTLEERQLILQWLRCNAPR